MSCYDRAMASSLASFLDSIRRALAVMLLDLEHRANTELLHAIISLLQIDPELRIKPGTLSMRFARDLPTDTFGDNLVHRRTHEASVSDNAGEERLRSVHMGVLERCGRGGESGGCEPEMRDSTGGNSEVGPFDLAAGSRMF